MRAARPRRALVHAAAPLDRTGGASAWAETAVRALHAADCHVTLVLAAPARTGRLVDALTALDGVTVRHPHAEGLVEGDAPLTVAAAHRVLARIDGDHPHDLLLVRGRAVAAALADDGALRGRLWPYLADLPWNLDGFTPRVQGELRRIARAAPVLLCPSEDARCLLEQAVPDACGKTVLLPPTAVPPVPDAPPRTVALSPLRLVHTGRLAAGRNVPEMARLPARLAAEDVPAELHLVGDAFEDDDAELADRVRRALDHASGVVRYGGHARDAALTLAADADVGLAWRAPDRAADPEPSATLPEFGALGLPVLLNRTPAHEALLGADYPLFAATEDDAVSALRRAAREPAVYALAAARCRAAAADFGLDRAADRLRTALAKAFPVPTVPQSARALRLVVAGHDLAAFAPVLRHLAALPGVEVRVDRWPSPTAHDEQRSADLVAWADVVVCERSGPTAAWYARRRRARQRIIVRPRRLEPGGDVVAADRVVVPGPHHAARAAATGWPAARTVVIPEAVDAADLDRPKLPGAEYHLGLIGAIPSGERLDLAADVVEELRRRDPRYTLFVRTRLPWEDPRVWARPDERAHYELLFRRLAASPSLADGVVFDEPGRDTAVWLRRVGFVLSTADAEDVRAAPLAGMASGAVAVVRDRPGADTVYDRRWIHRDAGEMADAIEVIVNGGRWEQERRIGAAQARDARGLPEVCAAWEELVRGA
ncbi:hypothetical protein [Actinomadura atramentaria]|uniref:hypothetical protein n=1 Tax=Actinomadura atramentaria TaxID=1990 RepID=UPI00037D8054|nr:hypothetical protein [Actinomadura atramentaria]